MCFKFCKNHFEIVFPKKSCNYIYNNHTRLQKLAIIEGPTVVGMGKYLQNFSSRVDDLATLHFPKKHQYLSGQQHYLQRKTQNRTHSTLPQKHQYFGGKQHYLHHGRLKTRPRNEEIQHCGNDHLVSTSS